MLTLFLNCIFIPWVFSAVVDSSNCPNVTPVKNFVYEAYLDGKWYELARYFNEVEDKGDCGITEISKNNGQYQFTLTEVFKGKINIIKYNAYAAKNRTGIIIAHSTGTEVDEENHTFPVNIVAVDYSKYCIGYKCMYVEETKKRHEYAWIQSRTKTLENSTKDTIYEFIKSSGYLDLDKFVWDHFTDEYCQVKN